MRNFNPGAVSRFRKLRALSRFMILCAYVLIALFFGLGVVFLGLYHEGQLTFGWLLAGLIVLGLGLVGTFCLFKFLGELAWLLADLGDHQLDVRNLLLDVRDDADRLIAVRDRKN